MSAQQSQFPHIELIFDRECPNVDRARAAIYDALVAVGAPPAWSEWDCAADDTPLLLRSFGSPTVLVNGDDVAGAERPQVQPDARSCRIYRDDRGCASGAPPVRLIIEAITAHAASRETV